MDCVVQHLGPEMLKSTASCGRLASGPNVGLSFPPAPIMQLGMECMGSK